MGFQVVKCPYVEGSKNGPVSKRACNGPVTGPYRPVNSYLCTHLRNFILNNIIVHKFISIYIDDCIKDMEAFGG